MVVKLLFRFVVSVAVVALHPLVVVHHVATLTTMYH